MRFYSATNGALVLGAVFRECRTLCVAFCWDARERRRFESDEDITAYGGFVGPFGAFYCVWHS